MYPSIYYVLKDLFGIDLPIFDVIKTFGLLMATAFVIAGLFLRRNLKWQEERGFIKGFTEKITVGAPASIGEIVGNAFLGFIVGFKIPQVYQNFEVFRERPETVLFNGDGNLIIGLVAGALYGFFQYWVKQKDVLDPPQVQEVTVMPHMRTMDFLMVAAIFGILGSKLLSSITDWETFIADPVGSLLSFQGLTWYGGFLMASAALIIFLKRKKIQLLRFMDAAGPTVLIGYGIGRLGCHFAGDGDWGDPNPNPDRFPFLPDWLWAYDYPGNVARAGELMEGCEGIYCRHLVPPVYPTPVWEFLMCTFLFVILMYLFRRIDIPGVLFGIYLVFNGVERFAIESIRVTAEYDFFGFNLTQAQVIALGLIAFGSAMAIFLYNRGRKQTYG